MPEGLSPSLRSAEVIGSQDAPTVPMAHSRTAVPSWPTLVLSSTALLGRSSGESPGTRTQLCGIHPNGANELVPGLAG
jgi:hypothetical protein